MLVGTAMMSRCLKSLECSTLIVSLSFGPRALFKWKGKSCPDGDASSCYLGHGDILVMDGHCQDEFLHCTDPGLECPLRAGVVCCLPTCAQGFSVLVMENGGFSTFWVLWELLGAMCVWGILVLLVFFLTGFGFRRGVFRWTHFLSGSRWGHFFRNSRGVSWITQKKCSSFSGCGDFGNFMLYMLALVGQPSLRGRDACMVFRANGASRRNCRQKKRKNSISPLQVFLLSRISGFFMGWGGSLASLDCLPGFVLSGLGFDVERLPLFGRLLHRRLLMLVMLGLVLLVCVVLLFRCLLLLLLVFGVFLTMVGLSGVFFPWVVVGLCIWLSGG